MPIYDYECNDCGCHFEKKQSFHDEPVAICPECEGKARRVLHAVPIIFKGSGFYSTDNRSTSTSTLTSKENREKSESKDSSSKDSSSKDTSTTKENKASEKKVDSKAK